MLLIVRRITGETTLNAALTENVESLKKLREDYINCSKCVEEATQAQNYVNSLKSDKEIRQKITNLIQDSNEAQSIANVALDNLDFLIKQDSNVKIPELQQKLTNNLNSLKANKNILDDKLSFNSYSVADNKEINELLKNTNKIIEEIELNAEKVTRFAKDNEKLLTSPKSTEL